MNWIELAVGLQLSLEKKTKKLHMLNRNQSESTSRIE